MNLKKINDKMNNITLKISSFLLILTGGLVLIIIIIFIDYSSPDDFLSITDQGTKIFRALVIGLILFCSGSIMYGLDQVLNAVRKLKK